MKMSKNLVSIAVLTVLLGCEHRDENTGNAVSAATDRNPAVQSQSDDSPETNVVDSKAVSFATHSTVFVATNQPEEIWTSDGFGFEDISLTNAPGVDEGTISLP